MQLTEIRSRPTTLILYWLVTPRNSSVLLKLLPETQRTRVCAEERNWQMGNIGQRVARGHVTYFQWAGTVCERWCLGSVKEKNKGKEAKSHHLDLLESFQG